MTPGGADELWDLLGARVGPGPLRWLEDTFGAVSRDRSALAVAFPAVGRHLGRQPLRPGGPAGPPRTGEEPWTVDDAGRALLLLAAGDDAWREVPDLYRFGDAAERRAVLRCLPLLPPDDRGVALVEDAVRTDDPRLLAAALGPYALARLGDDALGQAVLKCAFVGVPLAAIEGVHDRATPALARMLAAYVRERVAAGRDVPPDVWPLIEAHPPLDELAAIEAELAHPVADRRRAAAAALAQRDAHRRRGGPRPCASSSPTST